MEKVVKMCSSKKRFDNHSKAWKSAHKLNKIKGLKLYVYDCPYCAGYHLTRKKDRFKLRPDSRESGDALE